MRRCDLSVLSAQQVYELTMKPAKTELFSHKLLATRRSRLYKRGWLRDRLVILMRFADVFDYFRSGSP